MTYSCWDESCMIGLFFFSSRRRHTRFDCDWSSDVCSSDLGGGRRVSVEFGPETALGLPARVVRRLGLLGVVSFRNLHKVPSIRSEERRVGKSVDLGGRRIIKKKMK